MSYILDALRKSESDRYQEKLPELGGQAPLWMKKKGRRSIWPLLIVAALLVNALVAGVLLWPRQPPTVANVTASPARLNPPPEVHSEAAAGLDTPAATEALAVAETQTSTERETAQEAEVAPESYGENGFETDAPVTGDVSGFVRKPLVADSFADESGSDFLQQEAIEDEVISPQDAVKKGLADPDNAAGSSSRLAGIPLIDDLSREEKSRIPALKFSSHIYSSASDARRIVINQRYLREGQSVQGLRVVEITEEGVVLSLSGRVFQIPVLRDWSPDGS